MKEIAAFYSATIFFLETKEIATTSIISDSIPGSSPSGW